jgi:hypothetical protein
MKDTPEINEILITSGASPQLLSDEIIVSGKNMIIMVNERSFSPHN